MAELQTNGFLPVVVIGGTEMKRKIGYASATTVLAVGLVAIAGTISERNNQLLLAGWFKGVAFMGLLIGLHFVCRYLKENNEDNKAKGQNKEGHPFDG